MVTCSECGYAKPTGERCPNPVCYVGFGAYQRAISAWSAAKRAAGMTLAHRTGSWNANRAGEDAFERENPQPTRAQFERIA